MDVQKTSINHHELSIRAPLQPSQPQPQPSQPPPPQAVALSYSSSWRSPIIHYSLAGADWRQAPMTDVVSGGGGWKDASFPLQNGAAAAAAAAEAAGGSPTPLLEFVITDGNDSWDKASDGSNYSLHRPGRYVLRHGQLTPAAAPPVLVVTGGSQACP